MRSLVPNFAKNGPEVSGACWLKVVRVPLESREDSWKVGTGGGVEGWEG